MTYNLSNTQYLRFSLNYVNVILIINEDTMKFTRSAIKALGIVWRVRVTPTEPK